MEQLFLTILNRAVTAGWLVLLVMVLRVVLKKAPRAAHYGLWAIVAVRLLWPGDLLPRAGVTGYTKLTMVNGKVVWQDGKLMGVDERKLAAEGEALCTRVLREPCEAFHGLV